MVVDGAVLFVAQLCLARVSIAIRVATHEAPFIAS